MSNHKLFRLASTIYNTPHLIIPSEFEKILSYIDSRNFDLLLPQDQADIQDDNEQEDPDDIDDLIDADLGIAVIKVSGSLTPFPVFSACGQVGMAYSQIEEQVEDAIEAGCNTILMEFDSGGGSASHLFEMCQNIRQMCDEANVKLVGYVQETSCSACYAIAVCCDELYANPSACVGSIGCVVALCDTSKAMEQAGLKRVYLTSGTAKVPFDDDGTFKKSFLEDVQAAVDKLGNQFVEYVSSHTGIDAKIIRGFEAASFDADEALEKNLITGVMTNREFVSYLINKNNGGSDAE